MTKLSKRESETALREPDSLVTSVDDVRAKRYREQSKRH